MKKVLMGILSLIIVLGLVGCSSTPADGINTAEPAENPIEVTEDIVVTYNEFIKKCDEARVLPGLDYSKVLRLIENEDGFSFRRDGDEREEKTIFGNTDKDKNLTNVTIVCNGVEVSWIQDKEAIKNFYERFMNTDFTSMHGPTLSAMSDTYAAIDMVEMVYELISNKVGTLDAAIEILTSDSPVQVGKWSVSAVLDKDNYTVTIEAIYNK